MTSKPGGITYGDCLVHYLRCNVDASFHSMEESIVRDDHAQNSYANNTITGCDAIKILTETNEGNTRKCDFGVGEFCT